MESSNLHKFMDEEDNQICFDCGSKPAKWVSVNNAIFLCLTCSGNHRSLGVNISCIKSATLDKWNENQTKNVLLGGNTRLADLLERYQIGAETDFKTLYTSKLLDYYRQLVRIYN
jgi:ADP-ribosylation factor GTPase-activating protein 1